MSNVFGVYSTVHSIWFCLFSFFFGYLRVGQMIIFSTNHLKNKEVMKILTFDQLKLVVFQYLLVF